jgi:hypothetical protein
MDSAWEQKNQKRALLDHSTAANFTRFDFGFYDSFHPSAVRVRDTTSNRDRLLVFRKGLQAGKSARKFLSNTPFPTISS